MLTWEVSIPTVTIALEYAMQGHPCIIPRFSPKVEPSMCMDAWLRATLFIAQPMGIAKSVACTNLVITVIECYPIVGVKG